LVRGESHSVDVGKGAIRLGTFQGILSGIKDAPSFLQIQLAVNNILI
jgi:hypothetical protein